MSGLEELGTAVSIMFWAAGMQASAASAPSVQPGDPGETREQESAYPLTPSPTYTMAAFNHLHSIQQHPLPPVCLQHTATKHTASSSGSTES